MLPHSLDDLISIAAAKHTLGQLSGDDIHVIATKLLLSGIDYEEVLVLVDMKKPFASDLEDLFIRVIDKLGIKLPGVQEATLRIAREVASRIVSESLTPYDGARHIWCTLATIDGHDQLLDVFVGLASEYEDTASEKFRADYAQDIVREAKALLSESNHPSSAT